MFEKKSNSSIEKSRRSFIKSSVLSTGALALGASASFTSTAGANKQQEEKGSQRLSILKLKEWEALGYGMFIHFGMSTYLGKELPDGTADLSLYAPDNLNADQWIAIAKEAGMKYAVLTTKHVAGHCLWPSKYTGYTVANSTNKTDVVSQFVKACKKYNVKPGFYYCSWDNHHKFGSQTPSDLEWSKVMNSFPEENEKLAPFTTSMYQTFQTAQVTELLTQYGPVFEMWIDIPGVLGRGYRTFLYQHIAKLQPEIIIMMNSGIGNGEDYDIDYAWPSDLIAIERNLPPALGHKKWREIEGKKYYMPGEACDPIGKEWFYTEDDKPKPDDELVKQYTALRERGVNFLLDTGPDKHGVIPEKYVLALMRLKKNAGIK